MNEGVWRLSFVLDEFIISKFSELYKIRNNIRKTDVLMIFTDARLHEITSQPAFAPPTSRELESAVPLE